MVHPEGVQEPELRPKQNLRPELQGVPESCHLFPSFSTELAVGYAEPRHIPLTPMQALSRALLHGLLLVSSEISIEFSGGMAQASECQAVPGCCCSFRRHVRGVEINLCISPEMSRSPISGLGRRQNCTPHDVAQHGCAQVQTDCHIANPRLQTEAPTRVSDTSRVYRA